MRRVLAASFGWDGPGLGSAELTYHISGSPSSLTQAETNAAIETALSAWSGAADITFTPTNQAGRQDSIDISFTNIDGSSGILAQAYFPDDVNSGRIAGDIQFDISEAWEVGNSLGNQAFDLVWVAAHEIGHSLGLDHAVTIGSVLAPYVSPSQSFAGLGTSDIAAIQSLYAAADFTPTADTAEANVDEAAMDETPADETATDDPEDPGDADNDPFPRHRWRRGGNWHRFGGRLDSDLPEFFNYQNPTDVNSDDQTTALDALTIINQLNRSASGEDSVDVSMCDTNGDGEITAVDALTVINAMNNSEGTTTVTEITVAIESMDDESDTADTTVDEVDDSEDPTGDVDDSEAPVDDGGLVDDEDDTDVEDMDDEMCSGEGHRGGHHGDRQIGFAVGRFGRKVEQVFDRFDASGDGSLSEDELPSKLWEKLNAEGVDANEDGLITLEEIDAAMLAAREAKFTELDVDENGLLSEDEVSERFWTKLSDADTDADGSVSLDETIQWIAERETETETERDTMTSDTGERFGEARHHRQQGTDVVFAQIGRGFAAGRSRR
ncbi:Matrixin [Novipirellula artificiosorum]|uniref:Matrixin n=2 Tax=Novipirellula artificiosorum TaxID=2528016 RepID=A0A5C6D512_9BACT|nr:Matrixin [Novipirellula artificiosorum]